MMVQLALSSIVVILYAVGLANSQAFKTCRPGEFWKDECNKCVCTSAGVPRCTAYSCPPDAYHITKKLGECKPLSRWRVDCNYCECTETGEISCTNNICSANDLASDRFKREVKRCKPGSKWKDDCNDCVCTHTGYPSCTLKACDSQTYIIPNKKTKREAIQNPENIVLDRETREVKKCKPGSKWKDECNDCVCTHTGYPSCTLKACDSQTYIIPNSKSKRSAEAEQAQDRVTRQVKFCKPGTSWKDDCNKCVCTTTGKPKCTEMLCFPTDLPVVRDRRDVGACQPGTSWKQDCNTCTCSNEGIPACTLMACPPQTEYLQIKAKRSTEGSQDEPCKPGTSWREDCNDCFCSQDGEVACTLKACPSDHGTQYHSIKQRSTEACQPGSTWKDDCNVCHCSQNGLGETWTRKACFSQTNEQHPVVEPATKACKPGDQWKKGCNTCTCTKDGLPACTKKACLPEEQGSRKRRDACKPGDQWKKGCNTCTCTKDGLPACTKKACLPEEQGSRKRREACKPGDQWKEGCNTCTCTKQGNPACTRKACLPEEMNSRRKRETCTPGTTWKNGCNSCFCSEEGNAACTRKLCLPEEEQGTPLRRKRAPCTPGEKWKEGCNACYCLATGQPSCTRRACRRRRDTDCRPSMRLCGSPRESESSTRKRESRKLRGRGRCTPGSRWEQNCSTCFCDEQGNVGCVDNRTCHEEEDTKKTKEGVEGLKGRGRCEPGSTWQLLCNTCSCDQNGNMECTDYPCDSFDDQGEKESRKKRATDRNNKQRWCKPGDFMYFNCDKCPCGTLGITGCNYRTCKDI